MTEMISFYPDADNYEYHGIYGMVKLIIGLVYCKCPDFFSSKPNQTLNSKTDMPYTPRLSKIHNIALYL